MSRESYSRLFSRGNHCGKKISQALPQLLRRNRVNCSLRSGRVVGHVPNLTFRDGCFLRTILAKETDRLGSPARGTPLHVSPDARNAEVVAENRNPRFPDTANNSLDIFELFALTRSSQQNIVPVRGIKILDRRQFQTLVVDSFFQVPQFLVRPKLFAVIADTPIGTTVRGGKSHRAAKVVYPMSNDVRRIGLLRKTEVLTR